MIPQFLESAEAGGPRRLDPGVRGVWVVVFGGGGGGGSGGRRGGGGREGGGEWLHGAATVAEAASR